MRRRLWPLVAVLAFAVGTAVPVAAQPASDTRPQLTLAEVYRQGMPLQDYWVSEKYDGVRAWWDGRTLWTRGGQRIAAPAWFTAPLPAEPLDGELWAGRGRFAQAVSTVRSQTPDDAAWRGIRFMVFDLPAQPGTFTERLARMRERLPVAGAPWAQPVPQERATTHDALQARLDAVVRAGGEGLMLRHGASRYRAGRSSDLLKIKPYDDAEARVIAHLPGKGRHTGRLGALLVETPQGQRFRLGGGLSDAQRDDPPPVGSWVSYRYNGTTAKGLPRFARFLRVREDDFSP